jgi:hypothetical protein
VDERIVRAETLTEIGRAMAGKPRDYAPRGPADLAAFFNAKTGELDDLNNQLQEAHETLEGAEERWLEHYDEILGQLEDEGTKVHLLSTDLRNSVARRRGGWEVWTTYRKADRLVKRLESAAKKVDTIISACQSEARLLRSTS